MKKKDSLLTDSAVFIFNVCIFSMINLKKKMSRELNFIPNFPNYFTLYFAFRKCWLDGIILCRNHSL